MLRRERRRTSGGHLRKSRSLARRLTVFASRAHDYEVRAQRTGATSAARTAPQRVPVARGCDDAKPPALPRRRASLAYGACAARRRVERPCRRKDRLDPLARVHFLSRLDDLLIHPRGRQARWRGDSKKENIHAPRRGSWYGRTETARATPGRSWIRGRASPLTSHHGWRHRASTCGRQGRRGRFVCSRTIRFLNTASCRSRSPNTGDEASGLPWNPSSSSRNLPYLNSRTSSPASFARGEYAMGAGDHAAPMLHEC